MSRLPAHRHPAWFDRPIHRLRLIAELRAVGTGVRPIPTAHHPGGFALRVVLWPVGLAPIPVTIEFSANAPNTPCVHVPGLGSPHRYDDNSLCIWYPHDPPDRRWTRRDGGAALAAHICAHLIREAWWRQTGEWAGDEVLHPVPSPSPEAP